MQPTNVEMVQKMILNNVINEQIIETLLVNVRLCVLNMMNENQIVVIERLISEKHVQHVQ
jgi:hypothetical protein